MREKARLGKAEKFMLDALRTFEEREGVPIVLLDSYEDAVDRYGLRDSRLNDELPTAEEADHAGSPSPRAGHSSDGRFLARGWRRSVAGVPGTARRLRSGRRASRGDLATGASKARRRFL